MPKASVIRSVSSPQTEIRIEDSYESLKKTHAVDFEHQLKTINSINDEKLEVQMLSISNYTYPRNYIFGSYLYNITMYFFLTDLCRWTIRSTSQ